MNNRKIKSILVDGQGWKYSTEYMPITLIHKNGEMAPVDWFSVGDFMEVNGKYVIEIIYEEGE